MGPLLCTGCFVFDFPLCASCKSSHSLTLTVGSCTLQHAELRSACGFCAAMAMRSQWKGFGQCCNSTHAKQNLHNLTQGELAFCLQFPHSVQEQYSHDLTQGELAFLVQFPHAMQEQYSHNLTQGELRMKEQEFSGFEKANSKDQQSTKSLNIFSNRGVHHLQSIALVYTVYSRKSRS